MSILNSLVVSQQTRVVGNQSRSLQALRQRLYLALELQREAAIAQRDNTNFAPKGKRRTKGADGRSSMVEREIRWQRWYWRNAGGNYYISPRYGSTPLTLPGGNAFDCGSDLEGVIAVVRKLQEATQAGELDTALEAAAARRGKRGEPAAVPTTMDVPSEAPAAPVEGGKGKPPAKRAAS